MEVDVNTSESSINPLLIKLVVEKVFKHADFETLDMCRDVCQLWRNLAETPWRRKSPVQQSQQNSMMSNKIDISAQHIKGTDGWAASRFNKFHLSRFDFDSTWLIDYKLWKTHGKLITFLELDDCSITSASTFRDLILCKITPMLDTLKLTNVTFPFVAPRHIIQHDYLVEPTSLQNLEITYHNHYDVLPVSWSWILACLHHLQSLKLTNYATRRGSQVCELGRVFSGIQSFCKKYDHGHPLQRLYICDCSVYFPVQEFPDSMLHHFRDQCKRRNRADAGLLPFFSLQRVGVFASYPKDMEKCNELLSYQQNHLTGLKISSKYVPLRKSETLEEEQCLLQLHTMERLVRLDLQDYCPHTFKFLFACPNLEQLNILVSRSSQGRQVKCNPTRDERTGWGVEEKSTLVLPSLKSFHCNARIDWNEADMMKIGKWFPNLQSLFVVPNNSSFAGICQAFPQLKSLFLFDSKLTDSAFTGIVSNNGSIIIPNPRLPNITNLKRLQKFGLHSFISALRHPVSQLSEISITHGLLQIPSLKKLYIVKFRLTPSGFAILQNKSDIEVEICSAAEVAPDFITYATTPFLDNND